MPKVGSGTVTVDVAFLYVLVFMSTEKKECFSFQMNVVGTQ